MSPMNNRLLVPRKVPGLLDLVPGAAAAYSLRSLSNSYAGPVVTVRRSSDDAEEDFTAAEVADGTLAAFCGAGDGFVKTWHSQTGSNDATQTTAGYQPKIVSSGVVIMEEGKPAIQFDGSDDRLSADGVAAIVSGTDRPDSRFAVFKSSGTTPSEFFCFANSGNDIPLRGFLHNGTSSGVLVFFRDNAAVAKSHAVGTQTFSQKVAAFCCNGSSATVSLDGVVSATLDVDVGATTLNTATIGAVRRTTVGSFFNGTIQEIIVYPSDLTEQRELVEGIIAWGYSV